MRRKLLIAAAVGVLLFAALGLVGSILGGLWSHHRGVTRLPVGSNPQVFVATDLDGDGLLDLAVPNLGSNDVAIVRNRRGGQFAPALFVGVGMRPACVAAADFDGDGRSDLAVANLTSNDVSILLNGGAGAFGKPVSIPLGERAQFLIAADVDGDGDADLAVSAGRNYVLLLLNDGKGAFADVVKLETANYPNAMVVVDLDADGRPDVVTANNTSSPGNLAILWNRGGGTFEKAMYLEVGCGAYGLTVVDFDGDGDMDLAGTFIERRPQGDFESKNVVWVLRNDGLRKFARLGDLVAGAGVQSVAAGDFDRDGRQDLVAVGDAQGVWLFKSAGDGTFAGAVGLNAGSRPAAVAAADLDADGFPEIIVTNMGSNDVTVFWNRGGAFKGD